jgi:hypothetical protein
MANRSIIDYLPWEFADEKDFLSMVKMLKK